MTSSLFMNSGEVSEKATMASTPMGERAPNKRYKMPATLPGDAPPKSIKGADWVSGGIQSMTNLASSISDTKALGDWKLQQALIGVGLHPELARDLAVLVHQAREDGVHFQALKDSAAGVLLRSQLDALAERAWDIGGANEARDAGIMAHDAWEKRGQEASTLFSDSFAKLDGLLARHGFTRAVGLRERAVRNLAVNAAGRFDDILWHAPTRRWLIADLKTKRKPFWTMLEVDAQLAGYAYAEWMFDPATGGYVPGPAHHCDLSEGVVLHMPSDGGEPRLLKADLVTGWETLKLARRVCDQRSRARSAAHIAASIWPEIPAA